MDNRVTEEERVDPKGLVGGPRQPQRVLEGDILLKSSSPPALAGLVNKRVPRT